MHLCSSGRHHAFVLPSARARRTSACEKNETPDGPKFDCKQTAKDGPEFASLVPPYLPYPSYPRTLVSPYHRTIPPYPRTPIPSYSRTPEPPYSRTPVFRCPRTQVPPYPRTLAHPYLQSVGVAVAVRLLPDWPQQEHLSKGARAARAARTSTSARAARAARAVRAAARTVRGRGGRYRHRNGRPLLFFFIVQGPRAQPSPQRETPLTSEC